jgi:hypothetical protein
LTDRSITAATNLSPFFSHESLTVPDNPDLGNFWEFQRQFARAVFESLTYEECMVLFKTARRLGKFMEEFNLEELMLLFKVAHEIGKSFSRVDTEKVQDGTKAFSEGWRLMSHYRTTGEVT